MVAMQARPTLRARVPPDGQAFLDQDALDQTRQSAKQLMKAARELGIVIPQCVVAIPPRGRKDAGECTREEAWDAVAKALNLPLEKLGVDLDCRILPQHPPIVSPSAPKTACKNQTQ